MLFYVFNGFSWIRIRIILYGSRFRIQPFLIWIRIHGNDMGMPMAMGMPLVMPGGRGRSRNFSGAGAGNFKNGRFRQPWSGADQKRTDSTAVVKILNLSKKC